MGGTTIKKIYKPSIDISEEMMSSNLNLKVKLPKKEFFVYYTRLSIKIHN